MRIEVKSTRYHERAKLEIPVEVIYSENDEIAWNEKTRTDELSICGGGFTLSRPVEPKRLIQLRLPMPRKLRLFDFSKEHYNVWGIIRYAQLIQPNISNEIRLKVGTAFIGEKPPPSFLNDPATLYDIKPVLRNQSLWNWRELPRNTGRYVRSLEERLEISIEVIVEIVNDQGQIIESVVAKTLNVSESGMAVATNLSTNQPKYVLIKTIDTGISLLAKVRGVYAIDSTNETLRLHLEFLSGKWSI